MLKLLLNNKGIKNAEDASKCSVKLNKERNAITSISFKVFSDSACFSNLFPKITKVSFYDTREPEVLKFEGTLRTKVDRMDSDGKCYAECTAVHFIDVLHSTSVVGFRMWSGNWSTTSGLDARTAITKLIDYHNSVTPDEMHIGVKFDNRLATYVGTSVDYISAGTTYEAIMANINQNGWDYKPVYEDGMWKMSISADYGVISRQHVIVGVNMKDVSRSVDATDIVTRIIPIGGEGYVPFAKLNPTMDLAAGVIGIGDQPWAKTGPVTLYGFQKADPPYRNIGEEANNYIANPDLEKKYTPVTRVVEYSDIVCEIADDNITADETSLYTEAQRKLYDRCKADVIALTDMIEGYETTAFDLSKAGYDFKHFELFDICHIVNNQLEINTWLQIIAIEIDYEKPMESKLTFGKIGRSLARQLARSGKTTSQKIADNSHKANETLNQRTGGLNFRRLSSSEYEDITNKNDNTLYTVDDAGVDTASLYIGEKRISGGGAATTVETATVLTDATFSDFVIEEELMVDVVPPNRIYYGAHPSLCIVQGHYCLMSGGGISYDTETGKWTIGGIDGVYEKIIENKDKFGTQIGTQEGGGWLYHGSPTIAYPTKYGCISCEIYHIENLSNGIRIQTLARRWTADTVEPSGNWWESEMTWGTLVESSTTGGYYNQYLKAPDNSMYWTSTPKDIFIVPCVSFYNTPTSGSQSKRKHPYGYIVMKNYIVFASADGINYGVTQLMNTSNDQLLFACGALISEAENAFTLGISKRSEPIIDGGGG